MTQPAAPPEAPAPAPAPSIGTLAQASDPTVDPRTGEPRRPWSAWVAVILLDAGVATIVAGLLWSWWLSVGQWPDAAPLHRLVGERLGELTRGQLAWVRAGLAVAELAIVVLVGAAALIAGYYGWRGHRWARWFGVAGALLSLSALLLHQVAWFGIPLVLLGAVALWLPPTARFFARWQAVRHPEPRLPQLTDSVDYGPLPRYRGV